MFGLIGPTRKRTRTNIQDFSADVEEGGFVRVQGKALSKNISKATKEIEEFQQSVQEKFGGTSFGDRIF